MNDPKQALRWCLLAASPLFFLTGNAHSRGAVIARADAMIDLATVQLTVANPIPNYPPIAQSMDRLQGAAEAEAVWNGAERASSGLPVIGDPLAFTAAATNQGAKAAAKSYAAFVRADASCAGPSGVPFDAEADSEATARFAATLYPLLTYTLTFNYTYNLQVQTQLPGDHAAAAVDIEAFTALSPDLLDNELLRSPLFALPASHPSAMSSANGVGNQKVAAGSWTATTSWTTPTPARPSDLLGWDIFFSIGVWAETTASASPEPSGSLLLLIGLAAGSCSRLPLGRV